MVGAREWISRLTGFRGPAIPDAPTLPVRDPWPGDPGRGARVLKGEVEYLGTTKALLPGGFGSSQGTALIQ